MSIDYTTDRLRASSQMKRAGQVGSSVLASAVIIGVGAGPVFATMGGAPINNDGVKASATHFYHVTEDDAHALAKPKQGWGQNSINYFTKKFTDLGPWDARAKDRIKKYTQESCTDALNQALRRDPTAKRARVVQIAGGAQHYSKTEWGLHGAKEKNIRDWYNKPGIIDQVDAGLNGYTNALVKDVRDEFSTHVDRNSNETIVCVALNEHEPKEPGYNLSVTTDKGVTFDLAGGTKDPFTGNAINPVNDIIHAKSSTGVKEPVEAEVFLHWDDPMGKKSRKVASKKVTITSQGDTRSPNFFPEDFGWKVWPAGKFWFDVTVAKQQKMGNKVNTPDRDPRETFTAKPPKPRKDLYLPKSTVKLSPEQNLIAGQAYDARIVALNAGYSEMTLRDTVNLNKGIFFGGPTKDDVSKIQVLDPNGKPVKAAVSIDRTDKNKAVVNAKLDTSKAPIGYYTLVVPTYVAPDATQVGKDYQIPDMSTVCYGSALCLEGDKRNTRKISPIPDKVWVLDEKGALKAEDPKHSNAVSADNKVFAPSSPVSAVVNGSVPKKLSQNMNHYSIVDDWSSAASYIDFSDAKKAKVFLDGKDVTNQFDVKIDGHKTVATAKKEFLAKTKSLSGKSVKLVISGKFKADYNTPTPKKLTNTGYEKWNTETVKSNTPAVFTQTPDPDKAWVLDEKGALSTADPKETNKVGADGKVFLMNDKVYAVVNGKIPKNLGPKLSKYALTDDWSNAKKYIDFSDVSKTKVYLNGKDVTKQFTITSKDGKTVATAKKEFLNGTANRKTDGVVKLIVGGSFRDDYDTNGKRVSMVNKGFETWNTSTKPTNTPPVFTWTPDPHKEVIGSANQDGLNDNINGLDVFPGQWLEYTVTPDLNIPVNRAHDIHQFAIVDHFDPNFEPNKSSIEFFDARTQKVIPKTAYKVSWDKKNHSMRAEFNKQWIKDNLSESSKKGWLMMRMDGRVKMGTPPGSTVKNQAFQVINDAQTSTETPEVKVPQIKPNKEDLNTFMDNVEGKTVLKGDILRYRLTLDGGKPRNKLAYDVQKLGLTDDFDDAYLDVDPKMIKVKEKGSNTDVTKKFNISVENGVAYVFAKHVDRTNTHGDLIKGEQPKSLAEYRKKKLDPIKDPIIDQKLLGKQYYVVIDAKVKKDSDDKYVIKNKAIQNINNAEYATKIVSNPVGKINPSKDVVVDESTKKDSINNTEVPLFSTFNYRLNTSVIPKDLAYGGHHKDWSITDTFDHKHDAFTGMWAVYANADIYQGKTRIFKKGDLLADYAHHESETYKDLFVAKWDEKSHTFTVTATKKFMDLVNSNPKYEAAWSVYTKMERVAPGDPITNTHTETFNGTKRKSHEVKTRTTEKPALSVIKYDLEGGKQKGDRNEPENALHIDSAKIADGVKVGISITNTGNVPLKNISLKDTTHKGTTGQVDGLVCSIPLTENAANGLNPDKKPQPGLPSDEKPQDPIATPGNKPVPGNPEGDEIIDPADLDPVDLSPKDAAVGDRPEDVRAIANRKPVTDMSKTPEVKAKGDSGLVPAEKVNEMLEDGMLKSGQTIDCQGTVTGLKAGNAYRGTATAEATSIFSDAKVTASDDWNAQVEPGNDPSDNPSDKPSDEAPAPGEPGNPSDAPSDGTQKPDDSTEKPTDEAPAPGESTQTPGVADPEAEKPLPDKPGVQSGGQAAATYGGLAALLVALGGVAVAMYRKVRKQK